MIGPRRAGWGVLAVVLVVLAAAVLGAPSADAVEPGSLVYRAESATGATAPLDGATSRAKLRITPDGTDGVRAVRYEARGPQGTAGTVTATSAPFEAVLDLSAATAGTWTITAGITTAAGTRTLTATITVPAETGGTGGMPPISVDGDRIVRDGQPWWLVGYNSFVWSGDCGTEQEKMTAPEVDSWFSSMRHDGHGAVRLFFFPGWHQDRLDAALAAARRNKVYVTLTLADGRADCGQAAKDAGWFANAGNRQTYRRHMTGLAERYQGDPTIAWFEYFNEPTDAGGALRPFLDEMGAAAKAVDPQRLFSSGTLAPYAVGGASGYETINASPGVDIASLHEYDENEVESHHGPGARANADGKPVVVGEFGIKAGSGCGAGFASRARRIGAKTRAYIDKGYAGALAWAWQPGSGGCEYGTLDADVPTQDVLRTVGTPSAP